MSGAIHAPAESGSGLFDSSVGRLSSFLLDGLTRTGCERIAGNFELSERVCHVVLDSSRGPETLLGGRK